MVHNLENPIGTFAGSRFIEPDPVESPLDPLGKGMRQRIDFMASHMFHQIKEHEEAQRRTQVLYKQLLQQLEEAVVTFRESFLRRDIPVGSAYVQIDADRSIGIMHLLWHTISFTTRGNTRPMALKRREKQPVFSGRIVALSGDYRENVLSLSSQEFPDILEDEIASLYVPASPEQPVVMRFSHKQEELFLHPAEASQQFLLKTLEAVCGGGYFHELGPGR